MARFFIDRPIFAWVIAIVIMLAGALSISQLPLEQYPDIAPPTVRISATYTGASAKTVEDSVTQVIEQQMKGLDNLTYMSASSSSDGSASISLTFTAGTNPDVAQMQVQNKLQQAESRLPQSVQSEGLTVTKGGSDFLMIAALASDNPSVTGTQIGDYISSTLLDSISRIDGVGDVQTLGSGYAMRIWLDPALLEKYALMPSDVSTASGGAEHRGFCRSTRRHAGGEGAAVERHHQRPQQAANRRGVSQCGGQVYQRRCGRAAWGCGAVELGSESYDVSSALNGKPAAAMGVQLAAGANRPERRRGGEGQAQGAGTALSDGDATQERDCLRHHALCQPVHRRSGQVTGRGDCPGGADHVPFPAELAGHVDPRDHGAGGAAGYIRRAGAVRLFDQHPDHVRHGPGHRPVGGRRDCGGGERRAGNGRAGAVGPGRHAPVDG